ncbi:MAG: YgjV family protein [Acutalibacteraceae bacterium]|nr:YgjV family protein [Acutalibacteraceae bacterium]
MQQTIFIIGQILGVVTVILGFINYQVKTREQVLFVHIATTLCFAFHYMCLGAWTGMAMNFVGFVRNIIFYYIGKNGKVPKPWAIGFALVMVAMGIVGWQDWYSILAVVGIGINSYAMSFSNPNNIRKSILITSPMVLVYDGFVLSVGGMIYEAVVIVSSVIGIIRYRKKQNTDK